MLNFLRSVGHFIVDHLDIVAKILSIIIICIGVLYLVSSNPIPEAVPIDSNASDNSEPERKPKQVCRKKWFSLTDTWECWEE